MTEYSLEGGRGRTGRWSSGSRRCVRASAAVVIAVALQAGSVAGVGQVGPASAAPEPAGDSGLAGPSPGEQVDVRLPVPRGAVAPLSPTQLRSQCQSLRLRPGFELHRTTHAQRLLGYSAAWRFSRGEGQTVAVIDTGVAPHPRLGPVRAGGDYVSSGVGLDDCDAHGTLVAGIVAARPAPTDGFAGVAPAATVLAIRQSSLAFAARDRGGAAPGNVTTMAYAITRAVDLGATVINISQVACGPAGSDLGDRLLGRAVRYASERNVVVVAAAGNVGPNSACGEQNTPELIATTVSPARFSDDVLTVAATEPSGLPAAFSLAGPWVRVAAPGTDVTSLDPRSRGLADRQITSDGTASIDGTSFAAPYVAGLAALIRSRFPGLNAAEVIQRITSTARHPAGGWDPAVGYGVIDPVAALTVELPRRSEIVPGRLSPSPAREVDGRPIAVALIGTAVALVTTAAAVLSAGAVRAITYGRDAG